MSLMYGEKMKEKEKTMHAALPELLMVVYIILFTLMPSACVKAEQGILAGANISWKTYMIIPNFQGL